ncbi:unnamed protein product [Phytophthora lilii]|uniref:Unnamed protein product n=1 Tax=Phytophthora lilii TaxID=2077276 RepID=A0A9W6TU05_9STRA|nr:unnamed protein product [Phytophthora lilii]
MNTHQVAFFLNDEAQLDPREAGAEMTAGDHVGETTHFRVENGGNAGVGLELETKRPEYVVDTRRVSWHSFRARTAFAAVGVSSKADSLVVVGSELPDGYR